MSDVSKKLRIAFMGTPEFSVPALKVLVKSRHDVVAVYSQPPRPAGRGYALQKSPIHTYAETQNIPVYTPENFKKEADVDVFKNLNIDLAVVAAYGLLLPKTVLEAPRLGCINIHASLLPRWRGAAPIQRAIMAGDDETGICIMRMEEGLDTGPVMLRGATLITRDTNAQTLHDTLSDMGGDMIVQAVDMIAEGIAVFKEQNHDKSTYAKKIKKEEGLIEWTKSASEIDYQIRGLTPWPGCWCDIPQEDGRVLRLKILEAIVEPSAEGPAGMLLDKEGLIACAQGGLRLITVQPQSKTPMPAKDFFNGSSLKQGMLLHTGKLA